jgi:hypothetical protein
MQGDVRGIEANDIPDWPHWSPPDALRELQWFTITIGPPGDPGADLFQVAVATPLGMKERRIKGKFVGLVVDRFEPSMVEKAIREFVANSQALTWQGIVEILRAKMRWEYEGLRKA